MGCLDSSACNYDMLANTDDGSCVYPTTSATTMTACDSVVWNGTTYDSSGTYYSNIGSSNNYSMSFDGNDDYILLNPSLDISNTSFTLMAWIKRTNNDPCAYNYIFGDNSSPGWNNTLEFGFNGCASSCPGGGCIQFGFYGVGLSTSSSYSSNNWVNWSVTYNYSTLERKIYRNSILVANDYAPSPYSGPSNLIIGANYTYFADDFEGLMDNISVWNTVLSEQEIQDYMNCPPTGSESGLVGCWNFEEGSGNTALDISGNGNDGAINGATYDSNVPAQSCTLTNANGCDSTAILNLTIAVCGCTDSVANNYNPLATLDDSSCCYIINITATSTNIVCYGSSNGEVIGSAAGGTPGYSYEWFEFGNPVSFSANDTAFGLGAGSYFLEVMDANGCDTFASVNVIEPQTALGGSPQIFGVSCKGDASGMLVGDATGSWAPYRYERFDMSGNLLQISGMISERDTLFNLIADDYVLKIFDAQAHSTHTPPHTLAHQKSLKHNRQLINQIKYHALISYQKSVTNYPTYQTTHNDKVPNFL
jgi:hypothetical protein